MMLLKCESCWQLPQDKKLDINNRGRTSYEIYDFVVQLCSRHGVPNTSFLVYNVKDLGFNYCGLPLQVPRYHQPPLHPESFSTKHGRHAQNL